MAVIKEITELRFQQILTLSEDHECQEIVTGFRRILEIVLRSESMNAYLSILHL